MKRRFFFFLAASGAGLPVLKAAARPLGRVAGRDGAEGVGLRILSSLPAEQISRLRNLSAAPASRAALAAKVAEEHRAGQTVKVLGIALSLTEAAWCLAAAEGRPWFPESGEALS